MGNEKQIKQKFQASEILGLKAERDYQILEGVFCCVVYILKNGKIIESFPFEQDKKLVLSDMKQKVIDLKKEIKTLERNIKKIEKLR